MGDDFFDALHSIRPLFMRVGLNPPSAVVLATHEDGMRFLAAIKESAMLIYTAPHPAYRPVEHPDGSVWMEAEFAGVKFHWPANRYATEAGGYYYA